MTRLAVLGLSLEANTFSTVKATVARMTADRGIHRGSELVAEYGESTATFGGFLDPDVPAGVELIPLVGYQAGALGEFTAETFDQAVGDMVAELQANGPFDGVLLVLHGAAVAENHRDADAEVAAQVRGAIGPDVPIGVVLDMHANVDQRLVATVDVLRIYQTNPHVDARDRAIECRARVLEIIGGAARPVMVLEQLPLVVNIVRQDTSQEPLASILAHCRAMETRPGIVDVSVAEGFPYADVEQMGMAVLVTHESDAAVARGAAAEVADILWAARADLQGAGATPEEALGRVAGHHGGKPLLLLDVGDNIGGGSGGDSTTLLDAAAGLGVGGFAMSLCDPAAVAAIGDRQIGDRVRITVGGRTAEQDGTPHMLEAVITGRSDGRYEDPQPTHGGFRNYYAGPMTVLRTDSDVVVVLTTHLVGTTSPALFRSVGVEPGDFAAIVAKGVNSPKAGFGPVCSDQIMVDTPGVTRLSIERFAYRHRRTPMYPFETATTYIPGVPVQRPSGPTGR